MELTSAHLRYLLAIYEVSQTHLDISSRSIAEKLGVTKPSVVRIMNLLMEHGMIVKEHYGKIYMTDRGIYTLPSSWAMRWMRSLASHFSSFRCAQQIRVDSLFILAEIIFVCHGDHLQDARSQGCEDDAAVCESNPKEAV